MNPMDSAIDYLLENSRLQDWPECSRLIKHMAESPPKHWHLPATACLAAGGSPQQALPVTAAIAALHTSIVLVDELLDDDHHFEKLQLRKGDLANLAVTLFAAGLNAIHNSDIDETRQRQIVSNLQGMMISTALGQQWDAHATGLSEMDYWRIARQKSSPFFGSTFFIGAIAGGAPPDAAQALEEIGRIYGEMIQIHDDLKDAVCSPASKDWLAERPSLPILYALLIAHPDRARFAQIRLSVNDPDLLKEAQTILFRCGAVSYCAQSLIQRYQVIMGLLEQVALPKPGLIKETIQLIIAPVVHLFEKIGAPSPV